MNRQSVLQAVMQLGGLLAVIQFSTAQGTSVDCPGGGEKVLCNENQVAICWVSQDSTLERCLTPPEGVSGITLDLWLLSYVLNDTITVTDESIGSYREIIKKRRWEGKDYKVAFSLPDTWKGSR
jgi:hypothetical protein